MKYCATCKETKSTTAFSKNTSRSDGLQNRCKECRSRYQKDWYSNPGNATLQKARTITNKRNRRNKLRKIVLAYKLQNPCKDCGEKDPRCLDFDHVQGNKAFNISEAVSQIYPIDLLLREMTKCEVRCANCHRKITSIRLGK